MTERSGCHENCYSGYWYMLFLNYAVAGTGCEQGDFPVQEKKHQIARKKENGNHKKGYLGMPDKWVRMGVVQLHPRLP